MLALLLAIGAAVVVVAACSLAFTRPRADDEVNRFHRARQVTTEWSRGGEVEPVLDLVEPDTEAAELAAVAALSHSADSAN